MTHTMPRATSVPPSQARARGRRLANATAAHSWMSTRARTTPNRLQKMMSAVDSRVSVARSGSTASTRSRMCESSSSRVMKK